MGFCGLPKRLKPYVYIQNSFYRCKTCNLGHTNIVACMTHIAHDHPGVLPNGFRYGLGGRFTVND